MKVGDYVRNSSGKIAKYLGHEGNKYKFDTYIYWYYEYYNDYVYDEDYEEWLEEEEVRVYKNITDLIEVGDYVNGHKVIYTAGEKHKLVYVEYVNMGKLLEVKSYQIKSIVTKEQFESMEYKVGE